MTAKVIAPADSCRDHFYRFLKHFEALGSELHARMLGRSYMLWKASHLVSELASFS
jgi:hypothetical protein